MGQQGLAADCQGCNQVGPGKTPVKGLKERKWEGSSNLIQSRAGRSKIQLGVITAPDTGAVLLLSLNLSDG